mgnify:CR=1 FL=1
MADINKYLSCIKAHKSKNEVSMRAIDTLNTALKNLIQNEQFQSLFEQQVNEERMKSLPILTPIDIFIAMATDIDSLIDAAAVLINLEYPTRYQLIDALSIYIRSDCHFDLIREIILSDWNIKNST